MANAEPEIEAVRQALSDYLLTQLGTQFPTLETLSDWPAAGAKLPEYAIYVADTGEADITAHTPVVISSTPTTGANGTVTYVYGYAEGIQLELDCWAASKPKRDALQLAVRRAMARPPQQTLTGAVHADWPQVQRQMFVTIPVPGLFGSNFTYRFTPVPTVDEDSGKSQRNEWRSHFRGSADGALIDQDVTALMQRIHLTGNLGPGKLSGTADNQTILAQRPKP